MEIRPSVCPLDCPDLCSLDVSVQDNKVVAVNGSHLTPVTNGYVCAKVRNLADHLYCDERLATPLRRTGPKGTGAFTPISWDEALDEIVAKYRAILATSGGEAILPYHFGGSNGWLTEGALADRFFRRLGASRLDKTFCAAASVVATRGVYGVMPGIALEDFVHAKLIVLWGANPAASGIHLVPIIDQAIAAGAKLVVVDPRRTALAKRADLHVALQPGTDLVVALALGRALLAQGADTRFLQQHCTGVEAYAARAEPWTFEAAAEVAGVDAATLVQFYQLYRDLSPAAIRIGWGMERNRNGGSATAAVAALPALGNKFGKRGGGFCNFNGDARWQVSPEAAVMTPPTATRLVNMSEIARALQESRMRLAPPIESLFVYNCNPLATAPNQRALVEEFCREDLFVVVHDQIMTDTARYADLVLPATAFVEHRELRRGYGTMRMFDAKPVVPPFGQAQSNNWLFGELLRRMALTAPGEPMTDDELVAAIFASAPAGAQLERDIATHGCAVSPAGAAPVAFVDVFPGTPDHKVHLFDEGLNAATPHGLYTYQPDPATPTYPLALISPAVASQISSTFGQLRKKPATLELSPMDAAARGLQNGDLCRVFNELGEVIAPVTLSHDLKPGVVLMSKGYWHKHSRNGMTSNALIPERFADLAGQAAWNDARVQVERYH